MNVDRLLGVVRAIFCVHAEEADCDDCDAEMAHLAELINAGQDPAQLLPAVYEHMTICHDCQEELEALVAVLRAEAGELPGQENGADRP